MNVQIKLTIMFLFHKDDLISLYVVCLHVPQQLEYKPEAFHAASPGVKLNNHPELPG